MVDLLKYSSHFADMMAGGNPFPEDDPRHQPWEDFFRDWYEKDARFQATLPKLTQENFSDFIVDALAGRFDVAAEHVLTIARTDYQAYESFLDGSIEGWLEQARRFNDPDLLASVRFRLTQRKMHWTGEALRIVREGLEKGQTSISSLDINRILQKGQEALDRAATVLPSTGQPVGRSAQDQEKRASTNIAAEEKITTERLTATIECPSAARKMEAYLKSKGIGLTEFAIQAQTTDRTLRTFRKTGKVRRDIFDNIAKTMGTTRDALLKD